jgi:hypothetical protein
MGMNKIKLSTNDWDTGELKPWWSNLYVHVVEQYQGIMGQCRVPMNVKDTTFQSLLYNELSKYRAFFYDPGFWINGFIIELDEIDSVAFLLRWS